MATVDMKTLTIGETTYAPVDETARADNKTLADRVEDIENDTAGYLAQAKSAASTATTKASEAAASATTATDKASAASTSATNAASSATSASGSATTAGQKATAAAESATAAAASATTANTHANTAKGHADTASSKATAANNSAAAAKTSENNAADHQAAAMNYAQQALDNTGTAVLKAEAAAESASAAANSAASAASSASTASSKASAASTSAANAKTSETNAATSANTASSKASAASSSATQAANSAAEAKEAADSLGGGVPDYVQTEAERVAKLVQSRQGENTVTFLVCSDVHFSTVNNAAQMAESLTHMGQAMKIIRESVAVDFAACLGDSIWDGSNETVDDVQDAMREVNAALFPAFNGVQNFRLVGNHEAHYNGSTKLTAAQIFANTSAFNIGATFNEADRGGGYCYKDFEDRKLRVVCLNTTEDDQAGGYVMSAAQRTWLANALNVEDGWKSVILSHIPLDWYGANSAPLNTLAAADGVVCNVHGHIHNYLTGVVTGTNVPRLAIPNGCFYRSNEYGENGTTEYNGMEFGETNTYNKTAGTAQDTAFCVVTIDLDSEKIYADHYGAGYDREMSFSGSTSMTYSVTYNLTNATADTSVSSVTAGGSYTNALAAADGYENLAATVTMGGVDVTSSAYSNGAVNIGSVTGSIVITASATAIPVTPPSANYTNLVPTALDFDLDGVFNGVGYMNGKYISTSAPYYNTDASTVTTGLFEYTNTNLDGAYVVPPTIYVKGVTIDTANSHNRLGVSRPADNGAIMTTPKFSELGEVLTIETLGEQYYKLTPIMDGTSNAFYTKKNWIMGWIGFSFTGTGENLIITLDEPIE